MFILIAEFGGHLVKKGREEGIYSGVVLLEKLLSCSCGLLNGTYRGCGGLLYGVNNRVCGLRGIGLYCIGDGGEPGKERGTCNAVLPCNG